MSLRHHGSSATTETKPFLDSSNEVGTTDKLDLQKDKPYSALCWGCGLQLMLPSYSPIFKCGYCGAISVEEKAAACSLPRKRHPTQCPSYFVVRDRVTVTVVLGLISVLVGGGVWAVFPILFPNYDAWFVLNSLITCLLSMNTLFNFAMAVMSKAGPVHPMPWGNVEEVRRGSLERYTFCDKCSLPKPSGAHHCRQCRECVMEMDHHCPFIGNCVGANNQRYFVVFLMWVTMSCMYLAGVSIATMVHLWPTLFVFKGDLPLDGASEAFVAMEAIKSLLRFEAAFSLRMMLLGYLIMSATATTVGVGFLLYQQMQLIIEGKSYVESIQAGPTERRQSLGSAVVQGYLKRTLLQNLRRVFGNDPPHAWLWPRFVPPPGSYAAFLQSKTHTL